MRKWHALSGLVGAADVMVDCLMYFNNLQDDARAVDVVEMLCRLARRWAEPELTAIIIVETNRLLRISGAGFKFDFESQVIVPITSPLLTEQAVLPALRLLNVEGFEGPESEYLDALKAFRESRFSDAAGEAGKALESTLKAIIDRRNYGPPVRPELGGLLNLIFSKGLVPTWAQGVSPACARLWKASLAQGINPE